MKAIKEKIHELAEIAKSCPDNLQVVCFETLLKHYLAGLTQANPKKQVDAPAQEEKPEQDGAGGADPTRQIAPKQEDIKESDVHVRAKRFLEKESVTIAQVNNLFYKEGEKVLPLFDNLKTTRTAESQIRITLLQCLVAGLITGEFETEVAAVKTECTQRKCLDSSNFTANFRNNGTLFDSGKIDRHTSTLKLSDAGRKELADVIKELQ